MTFSTIISITITTIATTVIIDTHSVISTTACVCVFSIFTVFLMSFIFVKSTLKSPRYIKFTTVFLQYCLSSSAKDYLHKYKYIAYTILLLLLLIFRVQLYDIITVTLISILAISTIFHI